MAYFDYKKSFLNKKMSRPVRTKRKTSRVEFSDNESLKRKKVKLAENEPKLAENEPKLPDLNSLFGENFRGFVENLKFYEICAFLHYSENKIFSIDQ